MTNFWLLTERNYFMLWYTGYTSLSPLSGGTCIYQFTIQLHSSDYFSATHRKNEALLRCLDLKRGIYLVCTTLHKISSLVHLNPVWSDTHYLIFSFAISVVANSLHTYELWISEKEWKITLLNMLLIQNLYKLLTTAMNDEMVIDVNKHIICGLDPYKWYHQQSSVVYICVFY